MKFIIIFILVYIAYILFKIINETDKSNNVHPSNKYNYRVNIHEPFFKKNEFYCNQIRILNQDWIFFQLEQKDKFLNDRIETDIVLLTSKYEDVKFSDLNKYNSIIVGGVIYLGDKKMQEVTIEDLEENIEYIFEAIIEKLD